MYTHYSSIPSEYIFTEGARNYYFTTSPLLLLIHKVTYFLKNFFLNYSLAFTMGSLITFCSYSYLLDDKGHTNYKKKISIALSLGVAATLSTQIICEIFQTIASTSLVIFQTSFAYFTLGLSVFLLGRCIWVFYHPTEEKSFYFTKDNKNLS